jgi:hypothetical protein
MFYNISPWSVDTFDDYFGTTFIGIAQANSGAMTLSMTTFFKTTFSLMTHNIMTLSIMTLSIKGLYETLCKSGILHNNDLPLC